MLNPYFWPDKVPNVDSILKYFFMKENELIAVVMFHVRKHLKVNISP